MIFNKCLFIGEDCIIANLLLIFFKILVNFYIARNRLDLSVSLPRENTHVVSKPHRFSI